MSQAVPAKFELGAIFVDTGAVVDEAVVTVATPTPTTVLTPDEARRLAVTLIEQAARADTPLEVSTWP